MSLQSTVAMEDIERIEVFRGPNTVSYGANALMAVVNIITRRPADSHGTRMKITQGQRGINDFYASQGVGWEDGDLRLSLSGQQDDGCLLYTSPSPRDGLLSRMPSSA